MSRLPQLHRSLAIALAAGAIATPVAQAASDLRSPDTRDLATAAAQADGPALERHGRGPSAWYTLPKAAMQPDIPAPEPHGLRSPDTRIVATPRSFAPAAHDPVVPHHDSSSPWAWLVAAGAAALGATALLRHTMRRRRRVAA